MYEREAALFKALADENRLKILSILRCGEHCACRLQDELGIGQPTLSYHMNLLCSCGIVTARRQGRWTYYSLNREGCDSVYDILDALTTCTCSKPKARCCASGDDTSYDGAV